MSRRGILIILFAFAAMLPTFASAKAPRGQIGTARDAYRTPLPGVSKKNKFILRQDLFDRQNPTNLRSDWPSPPAQPGQI
jgi:hypothetical protein